MAKSLSNIIDWDAIENNDPMTEVCNIVKWLNKNGFEARYRVTERDSFGPVCVLISATKDQENYEYLY
jgi:hypothetical protein